jgi:hypothetical protein
MQAKRGDTLLEFATRLRSPQGTARIGWLVRPPIVMASRFAHSLLTGPIPHKVSADAHPLMT